MSGLTAKQDAYGAFMWDCFSGHTRQEIIERDDGHIDQGSDPQAYLLPYDRWSEHEKRAIGLARGRVLDIGCGAGRVALHLQNAKRLRVTAIDNSSLAIKVCKARGVKDARVRSITRVARRLGLFDTIVMCGNNFGLFGSFRRARWLLRRFRGLTTPDARIIAQTNDPYKTKNPDHLAYHRRNRARGRMGGQIRIRVRHKRLATPWFDYLFVSKDEMRRLVSGTGWRIARFFDSEGSVYYAVLEKERRP